MYKSIFKYSKIFLHNYGNLLSKYKSQLMRISQYKNENF